MTICYQDSLKHTCKFYSRRERRVHLNAGRMPATIKLSPSAFLATVPGPQPSFEDCAILNEASSLEGIRSGRQLASIFVRVFSLKPRRLSFVLYLIARSRIAEAIRGVRAGTR